MRVVRRRQPCHGGGGRLWGAQASGSTPKVYFTSYPGAGLASGAVLVIKPKDLQISGDASWIINDVKWSSWGASVARGTGISDVDNCTPQCADGKHLTVRSQIALSKLGRVDGHEVYRCFDIKSTGPPSFALEVAHESACLPT
jgi:hypothetical protein